MKSGLTNSLADVPGLAVGHVTLDSPGWLTGTTVVLAPAEGAVAGVDVRGGGPGTRETDLLDPRNAVERANALVLSGGSAYGLADRLKGLSMDYENMFRLDGRTAVVVGAGGGIGREAARGLAAQGARVVCADIRTETAKETASLIGDRGQAYELDVLDSAAVAAAAAEFADADVLVYTHAINVRKRLLQYSTEEFDRVVSLNLRSSFELIRAFGAPMVSRGRGSIIGFASIRSVTTEPGQGVYAATKAGLVQLTRTAAAEFGPSGVRVNVVAPGVVDTPLTAPIRENAAWRDAYASKSALQRWASASEMAGAVCYLASDAASFVTGSILFVDGGWTAIDGRFDPPM